MITRFTRFFQLAVIAVKAFVRRGLSSDVRLAPPASPGADISCSLDSAFLKTNGTLDDGKRKILSTNGEAVRMLGIAQDIPDRARIEEAPRTGEASLQVMADVAPVMLRVSGPDKL